ncbi:MULTISPECIES: DUF1707 and DUF4870 domain-containing protein [Streptomonospora]|uniref:DUF1707 and DUF4870 domain-containing protein n=1 Tax=Streptomonospora arabica TaxID=412417 RepID=A0ABV9SJ05_9ACTN
MAVYEPPSPPPAGGSRDPVPQRRRSGGQELRLTHADRDTAVETLRECYAAGQLDEDEFEERLGLAINAKFPSELEPLLTDLVPSQQRKVGRIASDKEDKEKEGPRSASDRMHASLGHFSGYFTFIGPLLLLATSRDVSPFVRRHLTEALNYQITVAVASIAAMALGFLILPLVLWGFMMLGWMFMPAVAGITALMGGEMRYLFTWRPVRDKSEQGA